MMQGHRICRFLFLLTALLAVAAMDPPSQPIVLSPEQAVKEGRALVNEMLSQLSQKPTENIATTGTMAIRRSKKFTQFPIEFTIRDTPTNWLSGYKATVTNFVVQVGIARTADRPNSYYQTSYALGGNGVPISAPSLNLIKGDGIYDPFVGSDFSIADLGLEFLHWPEQRLVEKEMKRSRSCRVLESINPHPVRGSYSRVKSWVDLETDGILYAEAFDIGGKKLKEFVPNFAKVNGQWQLGEMQIDNVQSDSRTTVKFNLGR